MTFQGWRIGGNLNEAQADILEPHIDVMIETLQELLRINTLNLTTQSQHALVLALTEYVGKAATYVNQISMYLATEKNPDEATLNMMASQLRLNLVTLSALTNVTIVALDKTLKE